MSKKPMKRGSASHQLNALALQKRKYEEIQYYRHRGMVEALDIVTLALGRKFGWREKRMSDLDEAMEEVTKEFHEIFKRDLDESGDGCEYGIAVFDRELKQYTGSRFCPWEERYDLTWHTNGLRMKEVKSETD